MFKLGSRVKDTIAKLIKLLCARRVDYTENFAEFLQTAFIGARIIRQVMLKARFISLPKANL